MRANKIWAAQVSALAMVLTLAGCGGGSGGGVSSTPTPVPTPSSTPANYTKIVDMSGDRTFQTTGVQFTQRNGFTDPSIQAPGNGVTLAYVQATDSYKLTAPDSTSVTVGPSNVGASEDSNSIQWNKSSVNSSNNGPVYDNVIITAPVVNGVALSYTVVGTWIHADVSAVTRIAVGGAPTIASDMPRSGTATYATTAGGKAYAALPSGTIFTAGTYLLTSSGANFSANFANNSITTSLNLSGTPQGGNGAVRSFGTFNGSGTIASSGPDFNGVLNGTGATGIFAGSFFGPGAREMAYAWYLQAADFSAAGWAAGIK